MLLLFSDPFQLGRKRLAFMFWVGIMSQVDMLREGWVERLER